MANARRTSLRRAAWRCLGLWGDSDKRAHGAADRTREIVVVTTRMPRWQIPVGRTSCIRRRSASNGRSSDLSGSNRPTCRTGDPGSIMAAGVCSTRSEPGSSAHSTSTPYRISAGGGRRPASDSRSVRCMPASSNPAISASPQWRDRGPPRGAARLCPQGYRIADGRSLDRDGVRLAGRAPPATARSPMHLRSRDAAEAALDIAGSGARGLAARADGGTRTARQSSSAISARSATTPLSR